MKKLICALIGAASLVASATTYIQTSATGTAPWRPVKDSVSQAHLADSARVAWFAHAATYADSSRESHISDSCRTCIYGRYLPLAGGYMDSNAHVEFPTNNSIFQEQLLFPGFASPHQYPAIRINRPYTVSQANDYGLAITSKTGWCMGLFSDSSYSGALYIKNEGQYGFAIDIYGSGRGIRVASGLTFIGGQLQLSESKNGIIRSDVDGYVFSDTNNYLTKSMTISASDSISKKVISDSLTANARAWTTLAAAKSSIHDSLTVERTFDTTASRSITHDTATALRTYVGSASTTGNAATATKLAAARTIGMSGDVTGTATAFDGSANITIPTTLPTLLTAGSAGSATSVPTLTWDAKGRLTAVGSAAISIPHTQISDWGTYINQPLLTTSSPTFVNVTANLIGSASDLGGVGSDYFVQGNGDGGWGHRTTILTGSAAFAQGLQSGFFDNDVAGVTPNNSWAFLVNAAHSGSFSANQYQFQIAASFDNSKSNNFGGEGYWVRVVNQPGGVGAWRTLLHNGNVGNYAIPLTGSSAITGPLVSSSTATFASAAIANGVYRNYANDATAGAIYGSSLVPSGQNYTLAWNQNGSGSYLNGTTSSNLFVNNTAVLSATATGITAYQPITGNLTGHASLDIPLTGSSAITGSLIPNSNVAYNLGSVGTKWAHVYANTVNASVSGDISSSGGSTFTGTLLVAGQISLSAVYLTTNASRTLSPYSGSVFIYTVSQTTTQTLQDGTIIGETITIKNAQNSSTLSISGNVNAGSSVIPSLTTSILSWDGSKWY